MGFTFAVDIMSNAPTSDVAVKFADYVFEILMWILNSDPHCGLNRRMCGAIPHTSNGAEAYAYHSHLNAELYVKNPNIHMFVDVVKKVQQRAYVAMTLCVAASTYSQA